MRRAIEGVNRGFEHLPGHHANPTELIMIDGVQYPVFVIEKTYNDGQLCNFVSDNGVDGPLYQDTIEGPQLAVYLWACARFKASKPN